MKDPSTVHYQTSELERIVESQTPLESRLLK